MPAEFDLEYNEETKKFDVTVSLPKGFPGNAVQQEAIDQLNYQISSIGDGSPKGTYATLKVETAYPTGNRNLCSYSRRTLYFWNGSSWASGGVYQSDGIADNSVKNTTP